jgi:hypothetical protein
MKHSYATPISLAKQRPTHIPLQNIKIESVRKFIQYTGIFLGLLLPLILGMISGFEYESYSEYYFSEAKIFFIGFLTFISLSFITMGRKWIISGISLLMLVYFNHLDYYYFHYVMAGIFFLNSAIIITIDKRFGLIGLVMFFLSPTLFISFYYFELIQVLMISLFHLLYLNLKFRLQLENTRLRLLNRRKLLNNRLLQIFINVYF